MLILVATSTKSSDYLMLPLDFELIFTAILYVFSEIKAKCTILILFETNAFAYTTNKHVVYLTFHLESIIWGATYSGTHLCCAKLLTNNIWSQELAKSPTLNIKYKFSNTTIY